MPDMMDAADIAFPHLGIYLKNVPKEFSVFGYTITLYAIIIAAGVLLAVKTCELVAKKIGEDGEIYWDIFVPLVFISVIGARVYYVIFSWDRIYKYDPISVFYIHQGGLAIYGGVLTGFATLAVLARIKKRSFLEITDMVMFGLLVGQCVGRWGNFTNREAFGQYTDSLFAMRLPLEAVRSGEITESIAEHFISGTNYIQVHPTFLYESCWNLALLVIMLLYVKHRRYKGEMILIYLGGYGLGRAIIEGLRTDQLKLWGTDIPVSQLLGICLLVFAVVTAVIVRIRLNSKGTEVSDQGSIDEHKDEEISGTDETSDQESIAEHQDEAHQVEKIFKKDENSNSE